GLGKRLRDGDLARFRPFTWPQLCQRDKKSKVRLKLRAAWRCTGCVACFVNLRVAKKHKCENTLGWRVRSQYGHGIAPALMEGLLTLGSSNAGRRPFGSMIVVATLNIQLAAAAKIYSIIGLFSEDERPLDVLCVQELGLDVPSAPTFVSMAQGAGLHVFLGSAESGKHRVAVISRFAGKAVHMCSDRAAAACFQLLCNGSLTKVLISSFYGCVHDEDAAMAGARAAVVGELAAGLAFSWDAAFENETLLPGTRESPTFRRLRSTEVSEEAWRAVWQAKDFEDELAAGLVNEAWVRLSDTAQDLLAEVPWLGEVPFFEMEHWGSLNDRIGELDQRQKTEAISQWRERLGQSEQEMVTWIRKREKLEVELARPRLAADEAVGAEWCEGAGGRHDRGPPFDSGATLDPSFTAEALMQSARATATKAAGPDDWLGAKWLLLPEGFWTAFARLWARVVELGVTPDGWRRGRVVLIEKPVSGHRPLTILPGAWRIGARLLVAQLGD
ncbi:Cacna1e, partial [Symbiodinium microadriaticum]